VKKLRTAFKISSLGALEGRPGFTARGKVTRRLMLTGPG